MTTLLDTPSGKVVLTPPQNHKNPRYRILVVEDDSHQLELNAVALIRFGYDVDTAVDGVTAWVALHDVSVNYNLLVTDNKMPRVTGLELIKKLRSEKMTLPVILASGTIPTEELKQNPWLKLDATLPKPFTTDELLVTVKKVLRAAESVTGSSQLLFRYYAMAGCKIPKTKKPAKASIRYR
jgi:two-component system OmpR family response regulator